MTDRSERLIPEVSCVDLTQNRPGASVRAKAVSIRQAEPLWTWIGRLLGMHTDERAWRLGARGEELVGRDIAKLDSAWHALHSVPLGRAGADIDHLLVGPAGVFSLNSKHHKYAEVLVDGDVVKVNGYRQPYIEKSRREARYVSTVLTRALGAPITVTGVIVVVNAGYFTVRSEPEDVFVVERRALRRTLVSKPCIQDRRLVDELFRVCRQPATWNR